MTSMDISNTIQPDSSQLNADDMIGSPVIITIREVSQGTAEQPVNIHSHEFPDRAYRPSKSMRRVIVAAWGPDAAQYAGRQLKLFRNPEIRFGREIVGGIEIEAMSHIDKPLDVPLTVSRGKRRKFTVQVLQAPPQQQQAPDVPALIEACAGDTESLRRLWTDMRDQGAPEDVLNLIANAVPPQTMTDQPDLGDDAA